MDGSLFLFHCFQIYVLLISTFKMVICLSVFLLLTKTCSGCSILVRLLCISLRKKLLGVEDYIVQGHSKIFKVNIWYIWGLLRVKHVNRHVIEVGEFLFLHPLQLSRPHD